MTRDFEKFVVFTVGGMLSTHQLQPPHSVIGDWTWLICLLVCWLGAFRYAFRIIMRD